MEELNNLELKKEKEMVNHPDHYGGESNKYEAIKIIEALEMSFSTGSALKYILRCGKKFEDVEDLEKAIWYLKRSIVNHNQKIKKQIKGSYYSTCNICVNIDVSQNLRTAVRYIIEERPLDAVEFVSREILAIKQYLEEKD